jgi:hypothetical protein
MRREVVAFNATASVFQRALVGLLDVRRPGNSGDRRCQQDRAGHDAIKHFRVTLGDHQRFPAAFRATYEIGAVDALPVSGLDQVLCHERRALVGAVSIVLTRAKVEVDRPVPLLAGVVLTALSWPASWVNTA